VLGETRSERTERLLSLRLEELAGTLERAGASAQAVGDQLDLASLATMHAVAVDLVTAERAAAIWRATRERHPALEALELRPLPARVAA
jgi:hypothetical protein